MNKKGVMIAAVALLLFGGVGVGVFFFAGKGDTDAQAAAAGTAAAAEEDVVSTIPETRQATEGWRGYENKAFRFGLLYPQELSVREYKEADGAMSATFENPSTGEGFQIYITPYNETQITPERFRLDVSSGVMKEPVDVIIVGVRGTMFWSKNSIMGETREVWFINNGFLYEIVTYKDLDAWLGTIMQSWKFI